MHSHHGTTGKLVAGLALLALIAAACTTERRWEPAAVEVTLTEFAIEVDGSAPSDRPLELRVRNAGNAVHNLKVEAEGQAYTTPMIDPGLTVTLSLPALKAGTYQLWCAVPGHREAGMETDLVLGTAARG